MVNASYMRPVPFLELLALGLTGFDQRRVSASNL
jgi:hypothetical protein